MPLLRTLARIVFAVFMTGALSPLSPTDRADFEFRTSTHDRLVDPSRNAQHGEGAVLTGNRTRLESAARSNDGGPGLTAQTGNFTAPGLISTTLQQQCAVRLIASTSSLAVRGPPQSI